VIRAICHEGGIYHLDRNFNFLSGKSDKSRSVGNREGKEGGKKTEAKTEGRNPAADLIQFLDFET
jgi:hypothetical protein